MKSEQIASLIEKAAEELGVVPQDVSPVQFRSYLTEQGISLPAAVIQIRGGYRNIRDAAFPPNPKAQVEKVRVQEQARINRSVSHAIAKDTLWFEQLEAVGSRVFSNKVVPSGNALKKDKTKTERYLNLVLSDLHFGALLDAREVPIGYGPVEEARRLAHVVREVSKYKLDYRVQTSLNIFLLGDIIENIMHDERSGAPLAEQTCTAMHLLVQAISYLSQHFKSVKVYCTTGNHGRNTARHKGRAVNQKFDSIETVIYYGIKQACAPLKNVEFEIPRFPYIVFDVFGMKGYATHGDNQFNPGYPNRTIDVGRITNVANAMNASLPDTDEYKLLVCGHVHAAAVSWLNNGSVLITNGALIPAGDYALSIGIPECANYQMIWESTREHLVGDVRAIQIPNSVDKDKTLDAVVKPFVDF